MYGKVRNKLRKEGTRNFKESSDFPVIDILPASFVNGFLIRPLFRKLPSVNNGSEWQEAQFALKIAYPSSCSCVNCAFPALTLSYLESAEIMAPINWVKASNIF